ncbi:MAG TPA: ferritin-like domain-containing protein [Thermoanaerobaculia bacterium]|nr:ferritin-like domain-containing protein [Thermoanaerobaculia bacterium]
MTTLEMADTANFRRVKFEWVQPTQLTLEGVSEPANRIARSDDRRDRPGIVSHLYKYGYIESVGAVTPKDELLALLNLAVEVEHSLLVQYLYAAASIQSGPVKSMVRDIAVQEMAHLITAENLLLAVGGPGVFHIGRDSARAASSFNPLPLNLEPISQLTLCEYVLAERPATIPESEPDVQDKVKELEQLVADKTGLHPHRVGALYAKIYWILQPTDAPFGPLPLTPDPAIGFVAGWHIKPGEFTPPDQTELHQAEPAEWHASSGPDMRIHPVADAATAVAAVNSIMEQGEGPAHTQESHFYKFLDALKQFESGAVPVLPLPMNPFVGHLPLGVSTGTALAHTYVRLWANLLNVRYSALLLNIGHALLTPRDNADRLLLIEFIFNRLMMSDLGGLIKQMISPTMRQLDPNSAPTFELLREDMPPSLQACWTRQSELLDIEKQIRDELRLRPELVADIFGQTLLDTLEANWQELRALVDLRLDGS